MNYTTICGRPVKCPDRSLPLVSFLMPTYGRCAKQPELLNEVVWWCLNQTYPNIELVILNDAINQKIECEDSRVRVVNWHERIPDLGTKMNVLTALAAGEICLPAEDDDISLPDRAAQAIGKLQKYDCWFPMMWCFAQVNCKAAIDGNGHGYTSSAFRRAAMLGGHPEAIQGHDREAARWMRENLAVNPAILTEPREVNYVYCWGNSLMHLSGTPNPISSFRTNHPGPGGVYRIDPQQRCDWKRIAGEAARAK